MITNRDARKAHVRDIHNGSDVWEAALVKYGER